MSENNRQVLCYVINGEMQFLYLFSLVVIRPCQHVYKIDKESNHEMMDMCQKKKKYITKSNHYQTQNIYLYLDINL